MKKCLKIILVGTITTVFRIVGQLLIPESKVVQTVLAPSVFVNSGTVPIAITIYGIFAYSMIAALYLLIEKNICGKKIVKGLKYGIACCLIWSIYLLEPLPHAVGMIDKIAYPIVDSITLLVMGVAVGFLSSTDSSSADTPTQHHWIKSIPISKIIILSAFFYVGRLMEYLFTDIYSSFQAEPLHTIIWMIVNGIIVAIVVLWFYNHLKTNNIIKRCLLTGGVLFGADLILFNFFIPIVFAADIPDLIMRTVVDVVAITVGLSILEIKVFKTRKVY